MFRIKQGLISLIDLCCYFFLSKALIHKSFKLGDEFNNFDRGIPTYHRNMTCLSFNTRLLRTSQILRCIFWEGEWLFAVFLPTTDFFIHIEISPCKLKELQFFTCTRCLWPLNSTGSIACHTHCDTGHLFKWSTQENNLSDLRFSREMK